MYVRGRREGVKSRGGFLFLYIYIYTYHHHISVALCTENPNTLSIIINHPLPPIRSPPLPTLSTRRVQFYSGQDQCYFSKARTSRLFISIYEYVYYCNARRIPFGGHTFPRFQRFFFFTVLYNIILCLLLFTAMIFFHVSAHC